MQPPRMARAAVDLAVRMLPAEHRERYAIEFYADLFGLPRKEQRRQALGVLLNVQQLAWALGDPAPDLERRPARRRDVRCMLHLHHYARRHILHPEDGVHFMLECTRCRKEVFLVPGDSWARGMAFGGAPGGGGGDGIGGL
jgi:hypothetical protein